MQSDFHPVPHTSRLNKKQRAFLMTKHLPPSHVRQNGPSKNHHSVLHPHRSTAKSHPPFAKSHHTTPENTHSAPHRIPPAQHCVTITARCVCVCNTRERAKNEARGAPRALTEPPGLAAEEYRAGTPRAERETDRWREIQVR